MYENQYKYAQSPYMGQSQVMTAFEELVEGAGNGGAMPFA